MAKMDALTGVLTEVGVKLHHARIIAATVDRMQWADMCADDLAALLFMWRQAGFEYGYKEGKEETADWLQLKGLPPETDPLAPNKEDCGG